MPQPPSQSVGQQVGQEPLSGTMFPGQAMQKQPLQLQPCQHPHPHQHPLHHHPHQMPANQTAPSGYGREMLRGEAQVVEKELILLHDCILNRRMCLTISDVYPMDPRRIFMGMRSGQTCRVC